MTHNGGKGLANINTLQPYDVLFMTDALRQSYGWYWVGATNPDHAYNSTYTDANGFPQSFPAGATAVQTSNLWVDGGNGTSWDMEYNVSKIPDANISLTLYPSSGGTLSAPTQVSPGLKRYTFSGDPIRLANDGVNTLPTILAQIVITQLNSPMVAGDVKIYRTGATGLLNAEWIARYDYLKAGCLRFMDPGDIIYNINRLWADRNTIGQQSITGPQKKSANYFGTASKTLNKYTIGSGYSFTDGAVGQFRITTAPTVLTVSTITAGNPSRIVFTGAHGLTTGNFITALWDFSGSGPWSTAFLATDAATGLWRQDAVTVINSTTVDIPLNSTGYAALAATLKFHPRIEVSNGTTTKRAIQATCRHYTEFALTTVPSLYTFSYDADLDVVIMSLTGFDDGWQCGIPVEIEVAMCNALQCDGLFVLPYRVDSTYITNFATYIRDNLNAGLTPYFEIGNEVWPVGTWLARYADAVQIKTVGGTTYHNGHYKARVTAMSDIVRPLFSGVRTCKIVSAVWSIAYDAGTVADRIDWTKIDAIATAPYYILPFTFQADAASYVGWPQAIYDYKIGGANRIAAFTWIADQLKHAPTDAAYVTAHPGVDTQQVDTWITSHLYSANGWGTRCIAQSKMHMHYEGGAGIYGPNSLDGGFPVSYSGQTQSVADLRACVFAYLQSDQHAAFVNYFLTQMYAAGVRYPGQYTAESPWNYDFVWGLQRRNAWNDPITPAATAFRTWSAPAAPTYPPGIPTVATLFF